MKPYILCIAVIILAMPGVASAEERSLEALSDNRIKVLPYDEGDVYTITTKYGYQTNIVFSANEEVQTISIGDRSMWQIIPAGNRLFIRPMSEGNTTNMTILTNKRSYQFDLKALGAEDKDDSNIYVAKFVYPDPRAKKTAQMAAAPVMSPPAPALMPAPATAAPSAHAITETLPAPNYNYTYSGPDTLAPLQVFDNGKTTFVKYHTVPDPLPKTYAVGAGGTRSSVPHRLEDRMMMIDTIAGTLELEHDNGTITIYNENLNPQ